MFTNRPLTPDWMIGRPAALLLSLCLAGCAEEAPASRADARKPAPTKHPVLTGATLEPNGYLTIIYAEPAPLGRPVPHRGYVPDPAAAKAIRTGRSAAPYLRIFPVMNRQMEPTIDIAIGGTLQLRDGCLRIAPRPGSQYQDAIAVFPEGSRAFVDAENYLTIGVNYPGRPATFRVGEELRFGPGPEVKDPKLIAAIRKSCGSAPLFWLKSPLGVYGDQLQRAAFDAPRTADIRGVSINVARRRMAEELQAREVHRRHCARAPDENCGINDAGKFEDSWLMPPPPPPPPVPKK